MTILINFHQSRYRTFKDYYQKHVCLYLRWAFPYLVSYSRFVQLIREAFLPLSVYLILDLAPAAVFPSLTQLRCRSARTGGFQRIGSSLDERDVRGPRWVVLSVIKELKSQTQLEHTRHRSFINFEVNVVSALIAYTYLEKKPSLNITELQEINDRFPGDPNF